MRYLKRAILNFRIDSAAMIRKLYYMKASWAHKKLYSKGTPGKFNWYSRTPLWVWNNYSNTALAAYEQLFVHPKIQCLFRLGSARHFARTEPDKRSNSTKQCSQCADLQLASAEVSAPSPAAPCHYFRGNTARGATSINSPCARCLQY